MSEEAEQVVVAAEEVPAEPEPAAEVPLASEPSESVELATAEAPPAEDNREPAKKSVTFDSELTFDEAQAEIGAIRSRAAQTREGLRTSVTPPKPSYTSATSSSSTSYSYESDAPKSKNMLSHLNSPSAMLNYKVQTARNLVRKQEDLLRNLARMRENMERSETEIGKASDFYTSGKYLPRKYDNYRTTVSSSRNQVQMSDPIAISIPHVEAERRSDRGYSPPAVASVSSFSVSSKPLPVSSSYNDYEPDENFEREMAAIRQRVAKLTKQANETTCKTKHSPYYEYEYLLSDSPSTTSQLTSNYDIYKVSEPSYEVTPATSASTYYSLPPTSYDYYSPPAAYLPASSASSSSSRLLPHYSKTDGFLPQSSYTEYVLDSLNEIPTGSCATSDVYTSDMYTSSPYYDDLIPGTTDLSSVVY